MKQHRQSNPNNHFQFLSLIHNFEKGKAIVLRDSLYGLVDDKGVEIIAPQYHLIQRIKGNNYLMAQNGLYKDNLQGILNKDGLVIVKPSYQDITIY